METQKQRSRNLLFLEKDDFPRPLHPKDACGHIIEKGRPKQSLVSEVQLPAGAQENEG